MKSSGGFLGGLVQLLSVGGILVLGLYIGYREGSLGRSTEVPPGTGEDRGVVEEAEAPEPKSVPWELEQREARLAAEVLAGENMALREEVADLQEQVRRVTAALASDRVKLDRLRMERDRDELGTAEVVSAGAVRQAGRPMRLVEVNQPLEMVVIDAGAVNGIRSGMRFTVLRDREPVARVRATDVRETLTGAVVEELYEDSFPAKADGVIPGTSKRR